MREKASDTFQSRFGLAAYCLPLHLSENRVPPVPMVNHHVFHDPIAGIMGYLNFWNCGLYYTYLWSQFLDGVSPICNPGWVSESLHCDVTEMMVGFRVIIPNWPRLQGWRILIIYPDSLWFFNVAKWKITLWQTGQPYIILYKSSILSSRAGNVFKLNNLGILVYTTQLPFQFGWWWWTNGWFGAQLKKHSDKPIVYRIKQHGFGL